MSYKKLNKQLTQIQLFIQDDDRVNTNVSTASTYWHIEHCLKIIDGVITILQQANPADHKPTFSVMKMVVMTTGYIPRGKARAPKETTPDGTPTKAKIKAMCDQALVKLETLKTVPQAACFKHPLFGWLRKKESLRFLGIHTAHHLKIIKDIVR